MSFIDAGRAGVVYAPGHFLAHEECTRKTTEIPQSMATTASDGSKYVPMGKIFPSADANAVGIVYEDVDVSTGNMPGSVVYKGEVYEDRLADAVDSYSTATVPTGGNPAELGLYERSGSAGSYVYTLTEDTSATEGKTYYQYDGKIIPSAAKTALIAAGITFVDDSVVTRPY
ncbi:MAG TPA: hypothetical protein DHV37_05745 [Erysipelotrichaceae bacterium]|nr:hypothetical protein [Erysipelotrichaceae bacterium]